MAARTKGRRFDDGAVCQHARLVTAPRAHVPRALFWQLPAVVAATAQASRRPTWRERQAVPAARWRTVFATRAASTGGQEIVVLATLGTENVTLP